jgi:succinate dehydrogenase (ubiquinone) cytochrome b560 subunit
MESSAVTPSGSPADSSSNGIVGNTEGDVNEPIIVLQIGYKYTVRRCSQISAANLPQNYNERMKNKGMPVSPHVTVFAFPMVALTSITNRVTGCALSFGCFGLGAAELLGSGNALALMQWTASHGMLMTAAAKFAVSFTAFYHAGGAARHFAWDAFPEYVNNEVAEKSSWQLIGASLGLSTITLFL